MIVCLNTIPFLADVLRQRNEVVTASAEEITRDFLKDNQCTALFVRTTVKVSSSLLRDTHVKFVGTATAGTDHVDEHFLQLHNIELRNAPGSNSNAVAEYALYSMLRYMQERSLSADQCTVGIIGFGHIGSKVGAYAKALGCRVVTNDPPLFATGWRPPQGIQYRELEELLSMSTIVTNHVPLSFDGPSPTAGMLHDERLALLQQGAHFIHASRGGVVRDGALLHAANVKDLVCTIDVWEGEPEYSLELGRKATIATPHISGHSEDGILNAAEQLAERFAQYSKQDLDLEPIRKNRNLLKRSISDFSGLEELRESLHLSLGLELYTDMLRHPQEDTIIGRQQHFRRLRTSYKGRKEILEPLH